MNCKKKGKRHDEKGTSKDVGAKGTFLKTRKVRLKKNGGPDRGLTRDPRRKIKKRFKVFRKTSPVERKEEYESHRECFPSVQWIAQRKEGLRVREGFGPPSGFFEFQRDLLVRPYKSQAIERGKNHYALLRKMNHSTPIGVLGTFPSSNWGGEAVWDTRGTRDQKGREMGRIRPRFYIRKGRNQGRHSGALRLSKKTFGEGGCKETLGLFRGGGGLGTIPRLVKSWSAGHPRYEVK